MPPSFYGTEYRNVCKKRLFFESCRFPKRAKTSAEACGICVVSLAKKAEINYTNGENAVTCFTFVFLNEDADGSDAVK